MTDFLKNNNNKINDWFLTQLYFEMVCYHSDTAPNFQILLPLNTTYYTANQTMAYVKCTFDYINHSSTHLFNKCLFGIIYMRGTVLSAKETRAKNRCSPTHKELSIQYTLHPSKFSTTSGVQDQIHKHGIYDPSLTYQLHL